MLTQRSLKNTRDQKKKKNQKKKNYWQAVPCLARVQRLNWSVDVEKQILGLVGVVIVPASAYIHNFHFCKPIAKCWVFKSDECARTQNRIEYSANAVSPNCSR